MDYLAPLSQDPDYTELPQEQRERVYRLLLAISHVPEDASVTKPGGVLDILSASTGMARDTVQRLWYDWDRSHDWRVLADKRSLRKAAAAREGCRSPRFRAWALTMLESNQRSTRRAIDAIHRIFRFGGTVVPGFEQWDYSSGRIPAGVSESSLRRIAKDHRHEMMIARQGYKAAASHRLPVLSTRVGMMPGQVYQCDDMDHDCYVQVGTQQVRIIEFAAVDYASGCRFHWGCTPKVRRETDGKKQGLTQKMYMMFMAYILRYIGFHKDGVQLVMERATASLPTEIVELLEGAGLGITVRTGGLQGARQKKVGGYTARPGGNPRGKGSIEQSHNPAHNITADLPGQTGKDRQHSPERLWGVLKSQEGVEKLRTALMDAGRNDLAEGLQNHILTYNQYLEIATMRYALWNNRHDHELEGWGKNTRLEYQVQPGDWRTPAELTENGKYPLSPLLVDSAKRNPGLVRERKMSPKEVWEAGHRDFARIPLWLYVEMIRSEKHFGKRVKVYGGLITVQDKYVSDDKLHYLAEVDCEGKRVTLQEGQEVWCVLNPYALEPLVILDEAGRILGEAPQYVRASPLDREATWELVGKVDSINTRRAAMQRARYEQEGMRVEAINEHNRAIAEEGGVYGRRAPKSSLTPAQKGMATRLAHSVGDEIDVLDLPAAPAPQPVPELPDDPDINIDDIIF